MSIRRMTIRRKAAAVCPDVVEQGSLTIERLVEWLSRKDARAYLWWD